MGFYLGSMTVYKSILKGLEHMVPYVSFIGEIKLVLVMLDVQNMLIESFFI